MYQDLPVPFFSVLFLDQPMSRNKMAIKLSVFSSLISNYSFNNNFCQKIIIYLESLYNTFYFDMKFIWKYWKMNSKSWQDGLFHGTKWRENYQCSRLWCQIILYIKIKLIVQAFQIYNYLLTEIIMKRIIWHQRREHW
jgi:hypothetical protein